MLEDLIISKVRVKLLKLFFSNPTELYHVRGLVRKVDEEINAVRRELIHLESAGLLKRESRGNRVYYWLNLGNPFYQDMISLLAKEVGLGDQIIKNRNRIGKITFCFFSGKFVRRMERPADEVDLLVVGNVVMPELAQLVKAEEEHRGKEVNYTVMSGEEFDFRKKRKDPFLQAVLAQSRVMILGDEEDLLK